MSLFYTRLYLVFIFLIISISVGYAQFNGGISAGHSNARIVNSVCAITSTNPFAGGISDGHSNVRIVNSICSVTTLNPFAGGVSDGHANVRIVNSVCAVTTINPFAGGVSDGHANVRIVNSICAVTTINPFAGGISDGHANARVVNSVCPVTTVNLFAGGISDGHANVRVVNSICAVTTSNPFAGGVSDGHANNRLVNVTPGECATTTPINLISFTANCNYPSVLLDWVTALETNNDYFSIERTVEGANAMVVGTVRGNGSTSTIQKYKFEDNISSFYSNETIYYRLKQTDYDGSYEYSSAIAVNNCQETVNGFKVFPNPTNGNLILNYPGDKEQIQSIQILNALGAQVKRYENYQAAINLSPMESGMYFIYIYLETTFFVEKVFLEK